MEKKLDFALLEDSKPNNIVSFPVPRFARDPADYKSDYKGSETFEEKLQRVHPVSINGNAMLNVFESLLADQILKEEINDREQGG